MAAASAARSQRGRPQAAEVDHGRPGAAAVDGLHRPHRRAPAHQDRDQARLRLSRPAVGRDPREHARLRRAGAGLRRQRPDEARDPRHLQQGHRRGDRRGRRRLSPGQGLHEAADAQPRQAREALRRCRAAVPARGRRGPARGDVPSGRPAEVGRLSGHQPDRGAGLDRHQLGPLDPRAQYRADRDRDQSRGRAGDRAPAAAARHGRASSSSTSSTWTTIPTSGRSRRR